MRRIYYIRSDIVKYSKNILKNIPQRRMCSFSAEACSTHLHGYSTKGIYHSQIGDKYT